MEKEKLIYSLDGRPPLKLAIPLGMQHILAMFIGNIAPILIISSALGIQQGQKIAMIQSAMFVAGIATLLQLYPVWKFGAKLPIVMGTSFAFVPTAIAVGKTYGYPGVLGGAMIGSFAAILMGLLIKYVRKYFSHIVTGSVLLAIGTSLLPTGINYFAGGVGSKDFGSPTNLLLGFTVLIIIIVLQSFGKGMWNISSILIALVVGYLVAIPLGKVNFAGVAQASWITVPMPLQFGVEFHLDAILKFAAVFFVVNLETIGNLSAITMAAEDRDATDKEMSGAIMADGLGSFFGAVFNVLPNTAFGQNAGIIAMTKIVNRFCIALGAGFLILAGIFPKIGAVASAMPSAVLGGAVVVVFSMITVSGIRAVASSGLKGRDGTILAITLGLGLGFPMIPGATEHMPGILKAFFEDSVLACGALSLFLNLIFPKDKSNENSNAEAA